MLYHSTFLVFVFLALLCAAGSSCSSTSVLSSDAKTVEEILRSTKAQPARVTLVSGNSISCFEVSIRKDYTHWRLSDSSSEVSMPTDSVVSIEAASPTFGSGILTGMLVGGVNGAALGAAIASNPNSYLKNNAVPWGGACGSFLGSIIGAIIGGFHKAVWTRESEDPGSIHEIRWKHAQKWDSWNQRWIYPPTDSLHRHDAKQTTLPY